MSDILSYVVGMYVATIPNRSSPPAILLRQGYRENGKVKNRTLANLSSWPADKLDALRRVLKGERLVPVESLFENIDSFHHGHVRAVRLAMQQLKFETLLASRSCRERDLVLAMVTAQILEPDSKLSMTRWWHSTTLAQDLGVADAAETELYDAMDWLVDRQESIEKKLAERHLKNGGLVLYDLSSSYFEGVTCPLAAFGHNRDGKRGKLQVNYGLLTDAQGRPVAISVFKGNTADTKTWLPQIEKAMKAFGLDTLVIVGDRGMISQKQIARFKELDGVDWITALKTGAIRALAQAGHIQLGLFDQRNLFELTHPDFPGERLVACRNPELAKLRAHKRQSLLEATRKELEKVRGMAGRGKLKSKGAIGIRVGKVVNKYKVAKHFQCDIRDDGFDFSIDERCVAAEAALDGIYVIRTSLSKEQLDADNTVRSYKMLSQVERVFRSLKSIDLEVRPIRHRLEQRVRSHILLCMLAQYVTWHMIEAWRSLLFCDEEKMAKQISDPVAPAQRSKAALRKVRSRVLDDGTVVHSFRSQLLNLSKIVRNVCRRPGAPSDEPTFNLTTTPNGAQQRAYDLLKAITV